jgi:hypothetical protein
MMKSCEFNMQDYDINESNDSLVKLENHCKQDSRILLATKIMNQN